MSIVGEQGREQGTILHTYRVHRFIREFIRLHLTGDTSLSLTNETTSYRGSRLKHGMSRQDYEHEFQRRAPPALARDIAARFSRAAQLRPFDRSQEAYDAAYGELYRFVDDALDAEDARASTERGEEAKVVDLGRERRWRDDPAGAIRDIRREYDELVAQFEDPDAHEQAHSAPPVSPGLTADRSADPIDDPPRPRGRSRLRVVR